MNDFTKAWLVMISITLVFYFAQLATYHENPEGSSQFMSQTTQLGNISSPGTDTTNPNNDLPGSDSINSDSGGNLFSDPLTLVWNWILGIPGAKYVTTLLSTPTWTLHLIGLPADIIFPLAALWYGLIILLTVMMITWRG